MKKPMKAVLGAMACLALLMSAALSPTLSQAMCVYNGSPDDYVFSAYFKCGTFCHNNWQYVYSHQCRPGKAGTLTVSDNAGSCSLPVDKHGWVTVKVSGFNGAAWSITAVSKHSDGSERTSCTYWTSLKPPNQKKQ